MYKLILIIACFYFANVQTCSSWISGKKSVDKDELDNTTESLDNTSENVQSTSSRETPEKSENDDESLVEITNGLHGLTYAVFGPGGQMFSVKDDNHYICNIKNVNNKKKTVCSKSTFKPESDEDYCYLNNYVQTEDGYSFYDKNAVKIFTKSKYEELCNDISKSVEFTHYTNNAIQSNSETGVECSDLKKPRNGKRRKCVYTKKRF